MSKRVVITGLGLLTPCGEGWKPYWEACLSGKTYIRKIQNINLEGFGEVYGGEIESFKPRSVVKNKKNLKLMSRDSQLAVVSSHYAIQDANLDLESLDLKRVGVIYGTGMINNDLNELGRGLQQGFENGEFSNLKFGRDGVNQLYPLWMLKYLPNMPACHIGIEHGLQGVCNTTTTSSAAGASAIGEAFRTIERGDADIIFAGGSDYKTNAMGLSRFRSLKMLADASNEINQTYLPFSENTKGLVMGEGAGTLILESLESAKNRGAKIYAEITGFGSASDFFDDPNQPNDFEGKVIAIQSALKDAGCDQNDIDLLIASGSGNSAHDQAEEKAIKQVFDFESLNICALKPVTGHMVYGSAGVEAAAAVLALSENKNPQTALVDKKTTIKSKDVSNIEVSLLNSFSFGGQNTSLVFKKWSES